MKKCIRCEKEKPLDNFYKWKGGHRGTCKECASEMAKMRRVKNAQSVGHNQKNLSLPSQEELKALFDYHKDGYFIRKVARGTQKVGSVHKGKLEKNGYRRTTISHNLYLTHRLIWMWHYGTEPKFLDHIDNDRVNNKIENLRDVTKNDNARHQLIPCNNSSGYFGVRWYDYDNSRIPPCWAVQITVNSKKIHLGYYQSKKDAVLAYNDAAVKLHGEFGKNKVDHNLKQLKEEGLI